MTLPSKLKDAETLIYECERLKQDQRTIQERTNRLQAAARVLVAVLKANEPTEKQKT